MACVQGDRKMTGPPSATPSHNNGDIINGSIETFSNLKAGEDIRNIVPTTEELVELEKEVHRLIERKRRTDLRIIDLEARIHATESSLLKEVSQYGPIFNGLEGYLAVGGGGIGSGIRSSNGANLGRKRGEIKETDRLFSATSASAPRALVVLPRLIREGALSAITIKGVTIGTNINSNNGGRGRDRKKEKSRTLSGASAGSTSRKRSRPSSSVNTDPAWSAPRRSRG